MLDHLKHVHVILYQRCIEVGSIYSLNLLALQWLPLFVCYLQVVKSLSQPDRLQVRELAVFLLYQVLYHLRDSCCRLPFLFAVFRVPPKEGRGILIL